MFKGRQPKDARMSREDGERLMQSRGAKLQATRTGFSIRAAAPQGHPRVVAPGPQVAQEQALTRSKGSDLEVMH